MASLWILLLIIIEISKIYCFVGIKSLEERWDQSIQSLLTALINSKTDQYQLNLFPANPGIEISSKNPPGKNNKSYVKLIIAMDLVIQLFNLMKSGESEEMKEIEEPKLGDETSKVNDKSNDVSKMKGRIHQLPFLQQVIAKDEEITNMLNEQDRIWWNKLIHLIIQFKASIDDDHSIISQIF